MMTKNQINEREQLEILTIEQLVPANHLVRKLDAAIDFSFIHPLVENLYSQFGRPSIDPVVLFLRKVIVNSNRILQFVRTVLFCSDVQKVRIIQNLFNVIYGKLMLKKLNTFVITRKLN